MHVEVPIVLAMDSAVDFRLPVFRRTTNNVLLSFKTNDLINVHAKHLPLNTWLGGNGIRDR
jgi:hypothetical protein